MIRLLLLLVFCVPLLAQNPVSADISSTTPSDSDLPPATWRWTGNLGEDVDTTETTITFETDDLDTLITPALITCGDEIILVSSVSTDDATVSRAIGTDMAAGGTGDAHSNGATCRANMTDRHLNAAYAWIKEVATSLGTAIWGTDDLIPYVVSGVLSGESAFTYDPDTNTLTADNITAGSGGGTVTFPEVASPGAPSTSGQHRLYVDSADNIWKSHENGGSEVEFFGDFNQPTLGTDTTGNYAGSASEAGPATTALALNANPAALTSGTYCADLNADGTCATENDLDDIGGTAATAQIENDAVTRDKVEAELRTHVVSFSIDPTVAASGEAQFRWGYPITLTEIRCDTDAGTVAATNLEERAPTTPNTAGTDTLTSDLTCDTNEEIGTTFTNASIDAWDPVALTFGTVTSATILRVHVEFTID